MSGEIQKQFLLTSKIGNGNFSTVYLAKNIKTQQIVAVKTMNNHIQIAIKEAQLLKKINHPNVIKMLQFQKPKDKDQALIVLEYVPQNILELYESNEYGLKQDQVKCILFQSCLGLHHIHKKGIIHRDIKPQNIMINRNKAEIKIIDFGLAIQQDRCSTDYVATRWYRAPENLLGTKQYTVAIDIFSLGCVIVELYLGNPLFPGANNIDQISKILTVIGQPTVQSWKKGYEQFVKLGLDFQTNNAKTINLKKVLSSCSQNMTKLIQKMLILNPLKRITAEQILKDSYFRDIYKIVPPQVYEQYLIDINNNDSNSYNIRKHSKPQVHRQTRQRIRFMSEQKSFGAFASFKPSNTPLQKLNHQVTKQKIQTDKKSNKLLTSYDKFHQIQLEKKDFSQENKSTKTTFLKNQINNALHQNFTIQTSQILKKVRKSMEKYQKNILKLNSSLKKIQSMKSYQENLSNSKEKLANNNFNNTNKVTESLKLNPRYQGFDIDAQSKNQSIKNKNATQMLTFRGFNQPKQKHSIKQSGNNFGKKTSFVHQKTENVFKNKKVMEYLQRFQSINTSNSKLQKNKLQSSRSQPIISQDLTDSRFRKPLNKPEVSFNVNNQSRLRQEQTIKIDSQSFKVYEHSARNSDNGLYLPKNSFIVQNNKKTLPDNHLPQQQINSAANLSRYSHYDQYGQTNFVGNSSQIQPLRVRQSSINGYLSQKAQTNSQAYQNQNKNEKNQNSVYFPHSNQSQLNSAHNSRRNSILINQNSSFHTAYPRNDHMICVYDQAPRNIQQPQYLHGPHKFQNSQPQSSFGLTSKYSLNSSVNRPIQNKIKLIAVRDDFSNNQQSKISLLGNSSLMNSSATFNSQKPHNQVNQQNYLINSPRKHAFTQNSLNSMRNSSYNNSMNPSFTSNYKLSEKIQTKKSRQINNQQKAKFYKSLQHRQFFTKNTSNRYSIDTSGESPNIGYPGKQIQPGVQVSKFLKQPIKQKNQTTLSQLRQSITGLTQTLNQGVFLSSDRSTETFNNKNINIKVNLNIYQKKSAHKR